MIQRVQGLDSPVMIIIREYSHISLMLFTITVNYWNMASMDSLER
jgi:hypothetical protein